MASFIQVDQKGFEKLKKQLSKSETEKAMRMAVNDAALRGRTLIRSSISEVYNIKNSRINDPAREKGLSVKKATNSDLRSMVYAGHIPVNLINISGVKLESAEVSQSFRYTKGAKRKLIKGKRNFRGGGISLEIVKGERKKINSAFVIGKFRHYRGGKSVSIPSSAVFARGQKGKVGFEFAKPRMPIDSISTISIATAATNTRAFDKWEGPITRYSSDRFFHHVKRMVEALNRGGGG